MSQLPKGMVFGNGDLMFFNAQLGAGAAAAFAAFLAGIVLQFLVRLATESSEQSDNAREPLEALGLLPLVLVMLLISAYMFILTGGRVSLPPCLKAHNCPDPLIATAPEKGSAAMFAIAGSMLAVGAAGALFGVVLVLEHRAPSAHRLVRANLYVAMAAVGLFLILGYEDIRRAFYPGSAGAIWWFGHSALLGAPAALGALWGRRSWVAGTRTIVLVGLLVLVLPVAVFLTISHTTMPATSSYAAGWPYWLTALSAAWAGLCAGGLLYVASDPGNGWTRVRAFQNGRGESLRMWVRKRLHHVAQRYKHSPISLAADEVENPGGPLP